MENKIKTWEEIEEILNGLRKSKTIVTTNGAFDILHLGHIKSFQKAKSFGDVLIVCLNTDSSIKRYKSKNRPINPQNQRAAMLAALESIDYVVLFDEDDPKNLLELIKPHKHVKSKSGFTGIEKEVLDKQGCEIILIEDVPGLSTTNFIKKVRESL
tara:strand:- start:23 stop:490 length:468 start_codon:yes stop_codon:yes gene_type:complete